ncbi:MAG: pseudoazurin [Cardiobacteriaceae bacterium]|nr:pseudoazurin [Cardiobacteriaceae bacterium]
MKHSLSKTIVSALAVLAFTAAHAAEHEVQMLDMKGDQPMVFDPPFLKIEPGDTVTFVPVNKSHWVESKLVPDGAEAFKSELDQRFSVTLNKEGVYLYVCPPHQMMNMVGVIQVGKPENLKAATDMAPKLERRAMSNKGRWEEYLNQIDLSGVPEIAEIIVKGDTLPKSAAQPGAEKGAATKP